MTKHNKLPPFKWARRVKLSKPIAFMATVLTSLSLFGLSETIDGITWKYDCEYDSNGELVSVVNGVTVPASTTGAMEVPYVLGSWKVAVIGRNAFYGCSWLKSIKMPSDVTIIRERAFYGCKELTSITIPSSVTSVGACAFEGCSSLLNVAIPDSVNSIGDYAFRSCRGLKSVTIPNSVTNIGHGAFEGCSGLTSVTIPNSVTSIGGSAFEGCSGLTSVTIGNGVTNISNYVFYNCSGIASVTVPQCVCNIGLSAIFPSSYQSISNVVVLDGVTSIGHFAFDGCGGLMSVMIPNSVTNIGGYAFRGCRALKSVTIPDGVTSIDIWTFSDCRGLRSVTIPDGVTNIWSSAFSGCSGLMSVKIADTVTSIGESAFGGCSGLTSVTIPASVTSISDLSFSGCSGLTAFVVGRGNPSYKSVSGLLLTKDGETLVAGVNGAVAIPDGVKRIGGYAFSGRSGLTSIAITDGVTSIGDSTFAGCSGLEGVRIPDSVANIGDYAFYGCSGLVSVSIGKGVTSIGERAFDGCSDALFDVATIAGVRLVDGWVVGSTVTFSGDLNLTGARGIGSCAFYGRPGLTSVTIPDSVKSIGSGAFSRCIRLTSVTIPDSVMSIGDYAFMNCEGLVSIVIPDKVTSIGIRTFWGCSALASVTIGNNVTSIGESAFGGCSGLTSVTIPASVTSIEVHAFFGCGGMMSVTITDTVTNIGNYAFSGCSGLASVYVSPGDADRVKELMERSGFDVNGVRFIEVEAVARFVSGEIDAAVNTAAASEYNGGLVDDDRNMKGTIQVKVGKPNKKTGLASVKATVQLGAKKVTLKAAGKGGVQIAADCPTELELVGGEECVIVLGADGLAGSYGAYAIDGARNFFASKDKAELNAANAILGKWLGGVSILADAGSFTVTISARGKAKVTGTLSNGKKATGNAVFLIGEEWACVPVVLPKANVSFALWLPLDGGEVVVSGLGDDVVAGRGGALNAGAEFRIDADEFASVTGIDALPYLPDGVSVEPKGAKWVAAGGAKAGKVAYKRGTQEVDESKLGENPSGLKLTYKKADGSFKGSFKVYAYVKGKLKATTVSVSGIVLNGVGYGTATVMGKGGVPVMIE